MTMSASSRSAVTSAAAEVTIALEVLPLEVVDVDDTVAVDVLRLQDELLAVGVGLGGVERGALRLEQGRLVVDAPPGCCPGRTTSRSAS